MSNPGKYMTLYVNSTSFMSRSYISTDPDSAHSVDLRLSLIDFFFFYSIIIINMKTTLNIKVMASFESKLTTVAVRIPHTRVYAEHFTVDGRRSIFRLSKKVYAFILRSTVEYGESTYDMFISL